MPPLVANLSRVREQATSMARAAAREDAAAIANLQDAGAYGLDVCLTLGAFISCYPPGREWVTEVGVQGVTAAGAC